MGKYEDDVREKIKSRFGSIPKMASATGIPATTIYHALDRGMDNTTTRTRKLILDALNEPHVEYSTIKIEESREQVDLSTDERELLALFRNMNDENRALLMMNARALSALSEKDGADAERAVRAGAVDAVRR